MPTTSDISLFGYIESTFLDNVGNHRIMRKIYENKMINNSENNETTKSL